MNYACISVRGFRMRARAKVALRPSLPVSLMLVLLGVLACGESASVYDFDTLGMISGLLPTSEQTLGLHMQAKMERHHQRAFRVYQY